MKRTILFLSILVTAMGGCPLNPGSDPGPEVTPQISISSTMGTAPLRVTVSGAASTSVNGDITAYEWDFAGQATADSVDATHLFSDPGRYSVALTVTDSSGVSATDSVEVRAAGTEPPTAIIVNDVSSGPTPLNVRFDGTDSSAPDDQIRDYFWDFGDGLESRLSAPFHAYQRAGTFLVELRVLTGGGLEGSATTTIVVGASDASLQFNGAQRASLPATGDAALTTSTFETWFKADTGGEVVSIGTGFKLEIIPAENTIRVTIAGTPYEAALANLAGSWQHVAVTFATGGESVMYHNGTPLATFASSDTVAVTDLIVGRGFRGNLGEMHFWSSQRSASEVAALMNSRLSGVEANLIGAWPMNAGSGQTVSNVALSGSDGVLGSSDTAETADAAWSTDAPPLP